MGAAGCGGTRGELFCWESPPPPRRPARSPEQARSFSPGALLCPAARQGLPVARGKAGQGLGLGTSVGTGTRCQGGGPESGSRGRALDLDSASWVRVWTLCDKWAAGLTLLVLWGLLRENRSSPDPRTREEPRALNPCPAQVTLWEGLVPKGPGVGLWLVLWVPRTLEPSWKFLDACVLALRTCSGRSGGVRALVLPLPASRRPPARGGKAWLHCACA